MTVVREEAINILAEGTRIEGTVVLDKVSRVHGTVVGELRATEGSLVILGESAVVEGDLKVDSVMIDGFVRGDVDARTRVTVSSTGRVVGNIRTPSLVVEFGAHFEGQCATTSDRPLKPA